MATKTGESAWARLVAWAAAEGSTVPMALVRIGLALLLWARWGEDMVLVHADGPAMVALSLGFFTATALMFVGLWTRAATATAAIVVATMYFGVGAAGGRTAWIHHHHFLLMSATVLCALTPCGRSLSIDRGRALARASRLGAPAPDERGPLLGLRLMTAQLSAIYLWSAIDKCEPGFLSGARLEQLAGFYYFGSDLPLGTAMTIASAIAASSIVALEFALAIGVWRPRWHRVLLPLGVLLHAALYVLLPVHTFSATMVLLYLAVIDPPAVERAVARVAPRADAARG
ncbi:HTTM domain-containing protein [Nannocystis bainbridge]|uniref:HTTM domain-containing protein n=1 Tax=Nannocystis bainbridge TaxID=2995303 RepID=A0ABT5DQ58_9BACT|nr:HTTM domain-containing protein [Nannocystis bainbridge]MDC0715799.1 HTTM domain-containing protein [Nannocystis bainbridge]